MSQRRFILDLQQGSDDKQTIQNLIQQLVYLVDQLNQANIPIVIGPGQERPIGLLTGQPIIDWSTGTTQLKTWDGQQLI